MLWGFVLNGYCERITFVARCPSLNLVKRQSAGRSEKELEDRVRAVLGNLDRTSAGLEVEQMVAAVQLKQLLLPLLDDISERRRRA